MKLEVRKIGDAIGLILPQEFLVRLGLEPGDALHATADGEGGVRLSPHDPDLRAPMRLVDEILDAYRDTLKELAK